MLSRRVLAFISLFLVAVTCHANKGLPKLPPLPPELAGNPAVDPSVWTSKKLDISYGATFDMTGKDPHHASVEEVYELTRTGEDGPAVLKYCVVSDDFKSCPSRRLVGSEIRIAYGVDLKKGQDYLARSYLYEELVLNGKFILVLVSDRSSGHPRAVVRLLNRFRNLRDQFGNANNRRMTTIVLPRNTFVALDNHEQEMSPSVDIIHYPAPFVSETLDPRTTVLTRVNPRIPTPLRWASQRLVSVGVDNLVGQWLLLSLSGMTPIVVIGWLIRRVRRKTQSVRADALVTEG